jgi:hypothetical protein
MAGRRRPLVVAMEIITRILAVTLVGVIALPAIIDRMHTGDESGRGNCRRTAQASPSPGIRLPR